MNIMICIAEAPVDAIYSQHGWACLQRPVGRVVLEFARENHDIACDTFAM